MFGVGFIIQIIQRMVDLFFMSSYGYGNGHMYMLSTSDTLLWIRSDYKATIAIFLILPTYGDLFIITKRERIAAAEHSLRDSNICFMHSDIEFQLPQIFNFF